MAYATICWMTPRMNDENSILDVSAKAVLIRNNGGTLHFDGTDAGSTIEVYDLQGRMVASVKASGGSCQVDTPLHAGEVGIMKIGERSVKVLLR